MSNSTPTGSVDGLLDAIEGIISDNTCTAYDEEDGSFTAIDDYSGLINDLEQLILAREEISYLKGVQWYAYELWRSYGNKPVTDVRLKKMLDVTEQKLRVLQSLPNTTKEG